MSGRTLREIADAADAERFCGRDAERAAVAALLDPETPSRILYVHGPGGIGKSAMLREVARMARDAGYRVASHDVRVLPSDVGALIEALLPAQAGPFCLLLDEADLLGAALAPLRDGLLDRLGSDTRIVLAGRAVPAALWRDASLPAIFAELPLGPLGTDAGARLLELAGIDDAERRTEIVTWAQGSPLALTVGAAVPVGGPLAAEVELEERLTAWLAGQALLDVEPAVLEVAAIARTVDARLVAAALPGRSTRDAMRRLAALRVVEPLGPDLTLHPVLAAAIRGRLRATAPMRYRELVGRIVRHLATRARLGEIDALIEMSLLIEGAEMRQAIASDPSATHYADAAEPGEFERFAREQGFAAEPGWAGLAEWEHRHEVEFVVRRGDGTALLHNRYARVAHLDRLGPGAAALRAAAAQTGVDPERAYAGITLFAEAPHAELAEVARLASGAFMQRIDLPTLEAVLMQLPPPDRNPGVNWSLGYPVTVPDGSVIAVDDFRPLDVVGFVEAIVLREQGLDSGMPGTADLLARDDDPVRHARLRELLDRTFDEGAEDRRLRAVIELAHLGPARREQDYLAALHVSRPTWYRLLRRARERVLATAAGEAGGAA